MFPSLSAEIIPHYQPCDNHHCPERITWGKGGRLRSQTLVNAIAGFALEKKAYNVVIMDLRKLTDMTDYFVICSADSDTQVKAIADAVMDGTEKLGTGVWHSEGMSQCQWVLLDYIDVVVHVFHKEVRKFYNLEKLWGDSVMRAVEDIPRARSRRAASGKSARKRPSKISS